MSQQFVLLLIGALLSGLLGGGVIARLASSSIVAKIREDFRSTFATTEQLNGYGQRLNKVEESKGRLFQGFDDVDRRVIRLEERVLEPMHRILDRLDKMEARDAEQSRLLDRAAHSLDTLSKTVEGLETRMNSLIRPAEP